MRATEQAGDAVGEAHSQFLVQALAFTIGLQRGEIARNGRPRQQAFGQCLHIAQGQVEALAGNRV
ncbi:hypothetical protein D3C76_1848370 [compost metagenome]